MSFNSKYASWEFLGFPLKLKNLTPLQIFTYGLFYSPTPLEICTYAPLYNPEGDRISKIMAYKFSNQCWEFALMQHYIIQTCWETISNDKNNDLRTLKLTN